MSSIILSLIVFPMAGRIKVLLILSRFIVGFFQIFLIIYMPVWVDKYGEENKTIWLTYLQLAVVLGVVVGYIITALFNILHASHHFISWRWAFYLQFVLLTGCLIFLYKTEEKSLATNDIFEIIETNSNNNFKNFPVRKMSLRTPSFVFENPIDMDMEEISSINIEEDFKKPENPPPPAKHLTIMETLAVIMKKRLFLLTMLTLCSLNFIITAIQFWISDYMIAILKFEKKNVFVLFVLISTTAPSLGLFIGGKIIDHLGGYTSKHAILYCLINSTIASMIGMPIPFLDNQTIVVILFWFLLFFGGSILPTLIGLMITSIPSETRNLGNAFAQFMFNLLGYFPSPILYGLVNSLDSCKFKSKPI
jgi:MFS family permease